MLLILLSPLLPVALAAPEGCEQPSSLMELDALAGQAEEAFAAADTQAFGSTWMAILSSIACLEALPGPRQIARVHRLGAIAYLSRGDQGGAGAAFLSARLLDDSWDFPGQLDPGRKLLPPDHPIERLYRDSLNRERKEPIPVESPAGLELWVDGTEGSAIPADRPYLAQVVRDADDQPVWGRYQDIGQPIPWDSIPMIPPEPVADTTAQQPAIEKERPRGLALRWSLAGGAAAATGGMLLLHRSSARNAAEELDSVSRYPTDAELNSARTRIDSLEGRYRAAGIGAGALGLATVGLTTWAVWGTW